MVRHFLGCDPCAKPAPNEQHVWIAQSRTESGVEAGRTYCHATGDLEAVIRKYGKDQYVIVVMHDGGDLEGGCGHEERFVKPKQAIDRWFEICAQAA